ncbi:pantoate--beta-alanine ligase [Rubrolithibacter danxiaensis]|uniref:pantoate--beta-alanine ligase n=1 Tax=Rubrolithibacter danxiaensis TaxID=3390805 RepID=UPI003BF79EB0
MKTFTTRKDLSDFLLTQKAAGKVLGLVPTMGALHAGHVSLINIARENSDVVICSIFVNPTQFNDPADLERYPRPVNDDIAKLEEAGCDVLFLPPVEEMYKQDEQWHLELGEVENILEGKFRPGHYQGVTQIVSKLFDIIKPDIAFFGQKDFQQFKIISRMTVLLKFPVKLVMCPIVREESGLALSSRNIHLSDKEHQQALALSKALQITKNNFTEKPLEALKADAIEFLNSSEGVELEYFEICNADDLQPVHSKNVQHIVALVAAYVGKTRLIDNLILK